MSVCGMCEELSAGLVHTCGHANPDIEWLDESENYDETCWRCNGEGTIVVCCDDICRGLGYCIHGDGEEVCPVCHGVG